MSDETYMMLAKRLVQPVRDAGKKIMQIHGAGVVANAKADGSPVTMADEAAEVILLQALHEMAPDIAVISEENAESHRLAPPDRFFLVDPLDGTKEFLRSDGQGAFTVNIGLVEMGVPVMGIVYAPALDRLFYGAVGQGAIEINAGNKREIGVRPVPASGVVAVASRSHRDAATNEWLEAHGISDTIATGSSLKFCLVAAGEADVYPRFGPTMEWDTAAGDAVLRAAGGRVIHPEGMPFTYGKTEYRNGGFVACGAFVPNAVA